MSANRFIRAFEVLLRHEVDFVVVGGVKERKVDVVVGGVKERNRSR